MMRKLIVSILCATVFGAARAVPATVDYIFDGDTFAAYVNLDDDIRISVRVRVANIDTPEINGRCPAEISAANRARDRLAELLPVGSRVELTNIKDDKYLGRIDANVILSDGRDAGQIMIDEKHARAYSGGRRESWCD